MAILSSEPSIVFGEQISIKPGHGVPVQGAMQTNCSQTDGKWHRPMPEMLSTQVPL